MAYLNNCNSHGNNGYYEAEREVVRESPYGSYSSEYRMDEYGNRVPHHAAHQHHGGVGGALSGIIPGGHNHHHHHGQPAEIIERREERIVDGSCGYEPYQRNCY